MPRYSRRVTRLLQPVAPAMVSVAGATGWRRRVTLREYRGMDAPLVASGLVGGNSVGFHVDGVGVAAGAGCSHVGRIDSRTRVRGGKSVVHTMAVDAGSYLGVTLLQSLPVHAGEILTQLVHTHLRIEAMHIGGIGVAAGAEIRGLIFFRSAAKAFGAAHGVHRLVAGIATMTIGTA